MNVGQAHDLKEKQRTEDIQISDNVEYSAMLLSDNVHKGLQKCGYQKPSPIQLKAIPLGRCGFDLIVKAKSGTGKTAVFVITALEMINISKKCVQVLVLGPTREIAVQIQQVMTHIGCEIQGLSAQYFIGGTPLAEDEKKLENCHIAVGAPGRIKHLIEKSLLDVSEIRLFVLDEADKLMESSFQQSINWIYNKLPKRKQVIAVSATYPDDLDTFLSNYMLSPTHVSPEAKMPVLLGIRQFYTTVKFHLNNIQQMKHKTEELTRILSNLSFNQCMVFSNYQTRAESLSNNLNQQGWPSRFISGQQDQSTRLQAVDDLRKFKCRILSSTDLTARGIDAANVDLVINYDVPFDIETYLHRMGRAGRYGSYGICITIVAEGKDVLNLQTMMRRLGNNVSIAKLPKTKLIKDIWRCNLNDFEQLYAIDDNDSENGSCLTYLSMDKDTDQEKCSQIEHKKLGYVENKSEQIVNSALDQLSDLLNKPYSASVKENDVKNITNLLDNLKNKKVETFDNLEDTSKLDSKSILNKLSLGTYSQENLNEKSQEHKEETKVGSVFENKKKKIEEVKFIPQENTQDFNDEALNFQQRTLLKKNIALFAITKLVMEDKFCEMFIKDCAKDIGSVLGIIKQEDETEFRKHTSEAIDKFLDLHNIPRNKVDKKNLRVSFSEEISHDKETKVICKCPENMFSAAYDYSVSSQLSFNWKNVFCDKHQPGESNVIDIPIDNKNKLENYSFDNEVSYEENISEMEYETTSVTDQEGTEENIFSSVYDKAIKGNIQNAGISHSVESKTEPFGYAAESPYSKKFVNFTRHCAEKSIKDNSSKKQMVSENPYVSSDLQNFIERRNVYTSYFQHYSNVLAETAPTFNNSNDFRAWFAKWKEEVETVRDFVQEDIFQKECNKRKF